LFSFNVPLPLIEFHLYLFVELDVERLESGHHDDPARALDARGSPTFIAPILPSCKEIFEFKKKRSVFQRDIRFRSERRDLGR
jgi:hypothetical protein